MTFRDQLMNLPTITVVVPTLNQSEFIGRCLDSVINQNYPRVECLVVDGGSRDKTKQILTEYGSNISWTSESDDGQAHAINKGISQTEGEIVCYLNSDDALPLGALHHIGLYFLENPRVDMVYGRAQIIDEDDSYRGDYPTADWDWRKFQAACIVCQPASFFRRSKWRQLGGFNENLHGAMDYEFWTRLYLEGAIIHYEPIMLGYTRYHPNTKTQRIRPRIYHEIIGMQIALIGQAHRQWWYEYMCCLKWEERSWKGRFVPKRLNRIRILAHVMEKVVGIREWNLLERGALFLLL